MDTKKINHNRNIIFFITITIVLCLAFIVQSVRITDNYKVVNYNLSIDWRANTIRRLNSYKPLFESNDEALELLNRLIIQKKTIQFSEKNSDYDKEIQFIKTKADETETKLNKVIFSNKSPYLLINENDFGDRGFVYLIIESVVFSLSVITTFIILFVIGRKYYEKSNLTNKNSTCV